MDCKETAVDAYTSHDLGAYQVELSRLMQENSPAIFANYSRAHARCIIRTFLESATRSVSILAGNFGNAFYSLPDIRAALQRAVENGARIRVISLCVDGKSMRTVRDLVTSMNNLSPGAIEVRFAMVRPGAQVKHYMVIDDARYRLEDVHSDDPESPVHAEVCCNGPGKARALSFSFDNVWRRLP